VPLSVLFFFFVLPFPSRCEYRVTFLPVRLRADHTRFPFLDVRLDEQSSRGDEISTSCLGPQGLQPLLGSFSPIFSFPLSRSRPQLLSYVFCAPFVPLVFVPFLLLSFAPRVKLYMCPTMRNDSVYGALPAQSSPRSRPTQVHNRGPDASACS